MVACISEKCGCKKEQKGIVTGFIQDWFPLGPLLVPRTAVPGRALARTLTFFKWGPRHPEDGYFTSYEEVEKMCFVWVPRAPRILVGDEERNAA